MKTFSEKLKYYREQKGMSQEKLAKTVGISSRTLQNYEKGDKEPTIGIAKKIANTLEISLSELINDKSINIPKIGNALKKAELNTKMYVDNKSRLQKAKELVNAVTAKKEIEVPFYEDIYASAGAYNKEIKPLNVLSFSENFLKTILNIVEYQGMHIIPEVGDSMQPTIYDGDKLFVLPLKDHDLKEGEFL